MSAIEWTDTTWNPVRGCSRVSPGCEHCYAMGQAHRFGGEGMPYEGMTRKTSRGVDWSGRVRLVPEMLGQPLRWRKPRRVFVNSMSDLFHESLPDEAIDQVFAVMALAPRHTFQILTKRAGRMRRYFDAEDLYARVLRVADQQLRPARPHLGSIGISDPRAGYRNVWLGVSTEDQQRADERIPELLATPAAVRFVSAEPLLGPLDLRDYLPCDTIGGVHMERFLDQVIVGGESGPGARPCYVPWIRSIRDQCRAARVACFIKQLGSVPAVIAALREDGWPEHVEFRKNLRATGVIRLRDSKGGSMSEWPEDLRVREFPSARPAEKGERPTP